MTAYVGEDLGPQPELANRFAVCPRLLRSNGRSELDILNAKGIKSLGNGNLGLGVEESIRELLSLYKDRRVQIESF